VFRRGPKWSERSSNAGYPSPAANFRCNRQNINLVCSFHPSYQNTIMAAPLSHPAIVGESQMTSLLLAVDVQTAGSERSTRNGQVGAATISPNVPSFLCVRRC